MSEIAALVTEQVRNFPFGTRQAVALDVGCVEGLGGSGEAAKRDLISFMKQRLVAAVYVIPGSPRACKSVSFSGDETTAVLAGEVRRAGNKMTIMPVLSWRSSRTPLPMFSGTVESREGVEEYYSLLGRAVESYIHEYPYVAVAAASQDGLSRTQRIESGLRFHREGLPLLAIATLQRDAGDNAEVNYALGASYLSVSAVLAAEQSLRRAIDLNRHHILAYRDLGAVLFRQRRYKDALQAYVQAGDAPGAQRKVATLQYLLGDLTAARAVATAIEKEEKNASDMTVLLARIDVREDNPAAAVGRITQSGVDCRDESCRRVAKEAAAALLQKNELDLAAKALTYVEPKDDEEFDDGELFMLQGRVSMALADKSRFEGDDAARAAEFFESALAVETSPVVGNPELEMVKLELAEAYFTAGNYRNAAAAAEKFIQAQGQGGAPPKRASISAELLVAVAKFLIAGSRYLEGSSKGDPLSILSKELPKQAFPELFISVYDQSSGTTVRTKVAKWSFQTIDKYTCARVPTA
ncbi:MAG: tetratricopeptide repeat protein, partial [Bradyrhizobium sp.]